MTPLEVFDFQQEHGRQLLAGSRNVVVHGDLEGPFRLQTTGDVHVLGAVEGGDAATSRVTAGGRLTVAEHVDSARLHGAQIDIHGDVDRSHLASETIIRAGGSIRNTVIESRFRDAVERDLSELERDLKQLARDVEAASGRARTQSKRVSRMAGQASANLILDVGTILQRQEDGLHVDLSQVYDAVGTEDEEVIETAVEKLFRRGIAGMLARQNRHYLSGARAREQAFAQMLRQLHVLLTQVRQRDGFQRQLQRRRDERAELIQRLASETDGLQIEVGGKLAPGCRLQLSMVRLFDPEALSLDLVEREVELRVTEDVSMDPAGRQRVEDGPLPAIERGRLRVEDDEVVIETGRTSDDLQSLTMEVAA